MSAEAVTVRWTIRTTHHDGTFGFASATAESDAWRLYRAACKDAGKTVKSIALGRHDSEGTHVLAEQEGRWQTS